MLKYTNLLSLIS